MRNVSIGLTLTRRSPGNLKQPRRTQHQALCHRPKELPLRANTPRGAKASAIMFSLIETAKECGLEPFKYLTYVFKMAPNWKDRPELFGHLLPGCTLDDCSAAVRRG